MIEEQTIRLTFYDGFDGPCIMLFGPMTTDLEPLRDCFRRLSVGEGPFDLEKMPFIHPGSNVRVRLQVSGSTGRYISRGIARQSATPHSFWWSHTVEEWDDLYELLDGFKGPGHQYLARYPEEDAVVVVSKGEHGDEMLR